MNDSLVKKKLHLRQESLNQGKMDGTFPSVTASMQLDRVGSFKKDRGTVASSMMSAASSNDQERDSMARRTNQSR